MNRYRHNVLTWVAMGLISLFVLLCWISYADYTHFVAYASPCMFLALCALFFANLKLSECIKKIDKELILVVTAILISAVNMVIIRSRIGAIFSIADILLILYLSDKIKLNRKQILLPTICCSIAFFVWVIIKKPSFLNHDFNTNGSAFILFTCGSLALCGWTYMTQGCSKKHIHTISVIVFSSIVYYYAISLLARGTILGITMFLISYFLLPRKPAVAFTILAGSILFPLLYLALWNTGFQMTMPIFEKSLYSGREVVWGEFFRVFSHHPITGIGSDLTRMVPNSPYPEAHHALLNILFVHGIPVFIIMLILWIKRFRSMFSAVNTPVFQKTAISLIYAMMVIGTFENYYISAPFNMILFLIISLLHQEANFNDKNCQYQK